MGHCYTCCYGSGWGTTIHAVMRSVGGTLLYMLLWEVGGWDTAIHALK